MVENISSKLPATDGESELLEDAIVELLEQIPETWTKYEPDSLTATQEKAQFLLVAAGMIERRGSFRVSIFNNPVTFEATWAATGESGIYEAVKSFAAAMWNEWSESWEEWQSGDTADDQPFHIESTPPLEWRLTDHGVIARSDIENEELRGLFSFVLKQGFWEGREPVIGSGSLISLDKKTGTPATVNIGNPEECADAFAEALGPMIEKMLQATAEEAKKKTPQNTEIPIEYLQSVGSGPKARPLFEYLWKNERATFDQLSKSVWADTITEEGTIIKAIERLEEK
jgi:hypothetical protein